MPTTYLNQNAAYQAQVDLLTVGGVPAAGNTIFGIINGKSVTYTLTGGDTAVSAASKLAALMGATSPPAAPAEFQEMTYTAASAIISVAAKTPGNPFTITVGSTGGGATIARTASVPNLSPSDTTNPSNWIRNGVATLPQAGDDLVVQDSAIPLLWNLDGLAGIPLASYTRWQSFTGAAGLPEVNPNGYIEYRPTYLKLTGLNANFTLLLGQGQSGEGPTRERYDCGASQAKVILLAAGSPQDDYAVRFLGSHVANIFDIFGSTLGVAMNPGESAVVASAVIANNGSIALGATVAFSGQLTLDGGKALLLCAPATILAQNGSSVIVSAAALSYGTVTVISSSSVEWLSDSSIATFTLKSGGTFDKSGDPRPMTITNSTMDGDTTKVSDPWSAITWNNPTVILNAVSSGPISFGAGRTLKLT